jgi:hypothetical protein
MNGAEFWSLMAVGVQQGKQGGCKLHCHNAWKKPSCWDKVLVNFEDVGMINKCKDQPKRCPWETKACQQAYEAEPSTYQAMIASLVCQAQR